MQPAPQGTTCDDGNLCTGSPPGPDGVDMCDGRNMGFAGCNNPGSKPNTCDGESPPGLGSYCYGSKGTCNKADGICYFPLLPAALRQAISANSYCGTWGGGFAAQLGELSTVRVVDILIAALASCNLLLLNSQSCMLHIWLHKHCLHRALTRLLPVLICQTSWTCLHTAPELTSNPTILTECTGILSLMFAYWWPSL